MRILALNHNQYAVAAIAVTLCLAGFYTIIDAGLSTTESGGFEPAGSDVIISDAEAQQTGRDTDGDGLPDRMEQTLYGTDDNNPDTDGDGLEDGWEVANGLDPLDSGEPDDRDIENTNADGEDAGEQNETFPDPDNGPYGDPDRDGLTNEQEAAIGTNPTASDSDGDGLNDRWESLYTETVQTPQGPVTLLDPLNPNWGCPLLTPQVEAEMQVIIGTSTWNSLPVGPNGDHSCDSVLDIDRQGPDSLPNYLEEIYDTNPLEEDSDGDLIPDRIEVGYGSQELQVHCGVPQFGTIRLDAPYTDLMSGVGDLTWFNEDMDGDGRLNGPGDWDTDGDGMPDGFEYCYNTLLNPANSTDAYGDGDEDGLNNVEEYEVAYTWGAVNFTNPLVADTDSDGMPDGWEYNSGIHPNDGSNAEEDPDFDGYDADGDGAVRYTDLVGISTVHNIVVEIGDFVQVNRTIMWVRTVQDSQYVNIPVKTPTEGYVYAINVQVGQEVTSRLQDLAIVVEDHERFTNLDEYRAKFSPDTDFNQPEEDWAILGRSTDPLVQDTDGDGLIDGIEVIGWTIRVVDMGVRDVIVYSDPGVYDTDRDGLSDSTEYYETFTNASDRDTDSDGLEDFTEAVDGFMWNGSVYFTNASMFDTDNDGLNDGEEVINGQDQYITHANNADTDDDGLSDGGEVLYIPRPWQSATNPLDNDTDDDGQPDGWEMQVFSVQQNTNSHSLWITTQNWLPIGCTSMIECGLGPGGWVWDSYLKGFQTSGDRNGDGVLDPKYFIHEMNLTGFTIPSDGRWALDPSFGSMPDSNFDIDNDTLLNALEAPDRWDTNPVDDDTDGDLLADGWEVSASERAISLGLVDNNTLDALGARGPMDPRMPDSDLDGIDDGSEDFDDDGLNRTHLLNDHDNDGMWSGWEFYFDFDPFDAADAFVDSDGDGYNNKCENKWNTNPKDPTSFPSQGELCTND